jgi:ABC-2 type transport system permease protein
MIETVRGLLSGTPVGAAGWLTAGWCLLISGLGYLWAKRRYNRRTV